MSWIREDKPFCPSRFPIFYGWMIVICSSIGILMSIPGQTIGVAVFTDHLMEVLGLSRGQLATAYMVGTITSSLFLTRAGTLYDRLGARRLAPWVGGLLGLTLVVLSSIDHIVDFLTVIFGRSLQIPLAFLTMALGFVCLRFFGQGVLTMVSRNMAMKWFAAKRGLINGIIGVVVSLGFSTSILGLDFLVGRFGWSGAWKVLGVMVGVIFTFFALVFFRDDPKWSGLVPDGKLTEESQETSSAAREQDLSEAKKSSAFWMFNFGLALIALLHTGISFHIVSIFQEAGLERAQGIGIFIPIAIIATVGSLLGGWASDHIKLKYFLAAMAAGMIATAAGLIGLADPGGKVILIIGMGVGQGMFSILVTVTWPRLFGIKNLGSISGYSMSLIVFASALGPAFFGYSLESFGHYHIASVCCLALSCLLLVGSVKAEG